MKRKRYPLSKTTRKMLGLMQDWGGACPILTFPCILIGDHRQVYGVESIDRLYRNGLIDWRYWPTLVCITKKGKQVLARGWR